MNRFFQITLCLLLLAFHAGAAQQEEFDRILAAIRQADKLIEEGKDRQAIAQFQLAQKTLIQFQKVYPDWDKQVVSFRLNYLNNRLKNWSGTAIVTSSGDSSSSEDVLQNRVAYLERANGQYQFQLKQLHDENARLSTKLREALAIRPAAEEPAVIAETQARLERSEIDFKQATKRVQELEAELAEYPALEAAKHNAELLDEMRKNLNQVAAEAEELRRTNETLRKGAATRTANSGEGGEASYKEVLAAQAAQGIAETELAQLRKENENLNLRLAALEARFSAASLVQSSAGIPQLNKVDSARMALAQGDNAQAAQLLKDALNESPKDAEVFYLMGRTQILQGKPIEAEASLKKVLELSPGSGVTHFELARLYYSKDKTSPGLARWHYLKALNLGYPRNAAFEKEIRWEQPGG